MRFREWALYHQIHPVKLATDLAAAVVALALLWHHAVALSVIVAFVPPVLVSAAMWVWPPDLDRLAHSPLGRYVTRYMTPAVAATRALSLVPMAYGAWRHDGRFIVLGAVILLAAWCNGLIRRAGSRIVRT